MALLLMALLLAAGCGKKGQLYLPDQPRPAATRDGKVTPAATAPKDDEPSPPSLPAAP